MGLPLPAAWGVVGVGSYVWHEGERVHVRAKEHASATIAVFTVEATPRRATAGTNVRFAMSRSEVVHYDSPPLLVDTAVPTTSGYVNVRHHEVQALHAVEIFTSPARLTFASRRLALLLPAPPVSQISSRSLPELPVTTPPCHTRCSRGAATTATLWHRRATRGWRRT